MAGLSLERSHVKGVKQGRLKDGDLTVIIGAGIGWVWGAVCVKWGPYEV